MALIAYLMERKDNYGPHLIIVPNAVMVNWKSELTQWLPTVRCVYYVGHKVGTLAAATCNHIRLINDVNPDARSCISLSYNVAHTPTQNMPHLRRSERASTRRRCRACSSTCSSRRTSTSCATGLALLRC